MRYAAKFFFSYDRSFEITEDYSKVEDFIKKHHQLSKVLNSRNIQGVTRNNFLSSFNRGYVKDVSISPRSGFLCSVKPTIKQRIPDYYSELLQFCLTTDVCDRLGINIFDLMHLDLVSYRKLRDLVRSTPKPESKELNELIQQQKI